MHLIKIAVNSNKDNYQLINCILLNYNIHSEQAEFLLKGLSIYFNIFLKGIISNRAVSFKLKFAFFRNSSPEQAIRVSVIKVIYLIINVFIHITYNQLVILNFSVILEEIKKGKRGVCGLIIVFTIITCNTVIYPGVSSCIIAYFIQ